MHGLEHSPWGFRGTRHGTSYTRQQHLSTLTPRPLPASSRRPFRAAVRPSPLAHGLPADEARPLPLPAVGALDVPLQVAGVVELAAADVTWERACGGDRSGHLASRAELNGARAVAERRGPRAPARPPPRAEVGGGVAGRDPAQRGAALSPGGRAEPRSTRDTQPGSGLAYCWRKQPCTFGDQEPQTRSALRSRGASRGGRPRHGGFCPHRRRLNGRHGRNARRPLSVRLRRRLPSF